MYINPPPPSVPPLCDQMYRRNALAMALQDRGIMGGLQTGSSNHANTTSRLDSGGGGKSVSSPSSSSSSWSTSLLASLADEDPTVSEEVVDRILAEASLADHLQLTPPPLSARGGGGGAVGSRNIFALLTDPRSVVGNSRLCVNASRSYYSAKAEMCSLMGRDWLDIIIRTMTTPTPTTTNITTTISAVIVGSTPDSGPGPDPSAVSTGRQGLPNPSPSPSPSPSSLRFDIDQVLDMHSNQWLGSDMPPTLGQIREVLELGARCADAAIGETDPPIPS